MEQYINGSDLLVMVGGKAIGHCTSHTVSYNTETKQTSVKPVATAASNISKWKSSRVTALSMQVKVDGLQFDGETEESIADLRAAWAAGLPVALKLFARGNDAAPYATGNFIVSSLEENNPAGDDASYSGTFDNDGAVTLTTGNGGSSDPNPNPNPDSDQ